MYLKTNDKVRVTLINKGQYEHLTEGSSKKLKVGGCNNLGFFLKSRHEMLLHFWAWHTGNGLFELSDGMIVKIEKRKSFWQWLFGVVN